jgi:CheY-like chemotaxis protein
MSLPKTTFPNYIYAVFYQTNSADKESFMPVWMAVEDESDINDVIIGMFEAWGVKGLSFTDGAQAIHWVGQVETSPAPHNLGGNLPELALIDIRLPNAPGVEVAAHIRGSSVLHGMAIILMTAYRLNPHEEEEILRYSNADLLVYKTLPAMRPLRTLLEDVLNSRKLKLAMEANS